jgi:7,8-dihydroneopterin aldolase/epimerase/oxygenase
LDRIELRNVVAHGRHGARPGERVRAQPFRLDLVVEADLTLAAATDQLADTIDYAALHARVVEIVRTHSYALLERLAEVILSEIFVDPRVARAQITIAKPNLLEGATPSVTLVRER